MIHLTFDAKQKLELHRFAGMPLPPQFKFNGGTVTLHTGGRNKRPEPPPREYDRGLVDAG
jgi:hypothetical protein